jgi:hypothetical protein
MNANGLYNGLDAGAAMGVYNGTNVGARAGLVGNEQNAKLLLLDRYPGAAAAYSLRKLSVNYNGPAIRVRRSNDNAEQDIGFSGNGDFNESALVSFVGANSGFVSVWYDQSGNSRNATRLVADDQPRIVNAGTVKRTNGKVSIEGDNTDYLETASNFSFQQLHSVGKINSYTTINYIVGSATVGIWYGGSSATAQGLGGFDGTNTRGITGEDLNQHLGWHSMRGLILYVAKDGTAETNTGTFAASLSINRLFGRAVLGGTFFQGDIQELIFYNYDNSSNRTTIESDINSYYKIY